MQLLYYRTGNTERVVLYFIPMYVHVQAFLIFIRHHDWATMRPQTVEGLSYFFNND